MTEVKATFYEILGVPRDADLATIKRQYKAMIKLAHPDAGGDPAKFQEITRAYRVLKDAEARAKYDKNGDTAEGSSHDDPLLNAAVAQIGFVLSSVFRRPDILGINVVHHLTQELKKSQLEHITGRKEADETISKLNRVLKKLRFKGKQQDVLTPMIQSQIANIELAKLNDIEQQKVIDKALELIDGGYDYIADAPGGPYQFAGYMPIKSPFFNDTTT